LCYPTQEYAESYEMSQNDYITAATAKELFKRGHLDTYALHRGLLGGWSVELSEAGTHKRILSSAAAPGTGRQFKTSDAAINAIADIGFSITVMSGRG
jgi:hypothetical protein